MYTADETTKNIQNSKRFNKKLFNCTIAVRFFAEAIQTHDPIA